MSGWEYEDPGKVVKADLYNRNTSILDGAEGQSAAAKLIQLSDVAQPALKLRNRESTLAWALECVDNADVSLFRVRKTGVSAVTPSGATLGLQRVLTNNYDLKGTMFVGWGDTVANIPPGWLYCDGTSGTPDLRGRFLVGLDLGNTLWDTLFETGGSSANHTHTHSHVHNMNSHVHGLNSHVHDMNCHTHNTDINHDHASVTSGTPSTTTTLQSGTGVTAAGSTHTHTVDLPALGTTLVLSSTPSIANTLGPSVADTLGPSVATTLDALDPGTFAPSITTSSAAHLPPYAAVRWIMRKAEA